MANWSSTLVELSGAKTNIKKCLADIKRNTKDGWLCPLQLMKKQDPTLDDTTVNNRALFGGGELIEIDCVEDKIFLTMQGRWCSPSGYFIAIAKKYNLKMMYNDEEEGCNFFHLVRVEKKEVIENNEYPYFSQESIDFNGIDTYIDNYEYLGEDLYEAEKSNDNEKLKAFKSDNEDTLFLFAKNGYDLEKLKEEWGVEA